MGVDEGIGNLPEIHFGKMDFLLAFIFLGVLHTAIQKILQILQTKNPVIKFDDSRTTAVIFIQARYLNIKSPQLRL